MEYVKPIVKPNRDICNYNAFKYIYLIYTYSARLRHHTQCEPCNYGAWRFLQQ